MAVSPLTVPVGGFEAYRQAALNKGGIRYTGKGSRIRRGEYAGMDMGQFEEGVRESYAKQVGAENDGGRLQVSTPRLDAMSGRATQAWEDRANMRDVTTNREAEAMQAAKDDEYSRLTEPARAAMETGDGLNSPLSPIGPAFRADKAPGAASGGVGAAAGAAKLGKLVGETPATATPATPAKPARLADEFKTPALDAMSGAQAQVSPVKAPPAVGAGASATKPGGDMATGQAAKPRHSWEQPGYESSGDVTRRFAARNAVQQARGIDAAMGGVLKRATDGTGVTDKEIADVERKTGKPFISPLKAFRSGAVAQR